MSRPSRDPALASRAAAKAVDREFLLAFWKVHILHHAGEEPVVGQWMIRELRRHGYEVSPGTLYPLLHRLEGDGLIRAKWDTSTGRKRKWYELTAAGKKRLTTQAHEWYAYADVLRRLLESVVAPPQPA